MTAKDGIATLPEIYRRLLDAYGPQGWWPGDSRFEMIAGAILTQAAAWRNVELALANLRAAGIDDWPAVHRIDIDALAELVRPSGYYNAKARKLKAFAAHMCEEYGGDLDAMFAAGTDTLRRELLNIYGIGPETADDILLYAAGKPSFVIDAYTIRIMERVGLTPKGRADYGGWQAMFHAALPADVAMYNEYHALLDRHHKEACTKNAPRCKGCCLQDVCATGRAW
ncbi:MAG: endonuclease [Chloroflexi bacterium]|nr:endonuclease [Chloroflexota bacterium]MYD49754.1 endonuclease [Chloroflexota bacterium]